MARAPYKLPNVFVGCSYDNERFSYRRLDSALQSLPIRIHYAHTGLRTKHLLGILRDYIKTVDYCIFDLSLWNANVSLELGLADALECPYYILLNKKLKKGVPADIQGLQRIEYDSYDNLESETGLIPQLVKYLVRDDLTHPKRIWEELTNRNRDRKYIFALRILAHFKEHKRLQQGDLAGLVRGTRLRREEQAEVLDILTNQNLIGGMQTRRGAFLKKNLYKDPVLVRTARR